MGTIGRVALLEKVRHWGWTLEIQRMCLLSLPSLPPVYGSRCELSGAASVACHLLPPPLRHHGLLSLWNQKPEIIPSFSKKPWPTKKSSRQKLILGNDCHCEGPCFVEEYGRFCDFETRKC